MPRSWLLTWYILLACHRRFVVNNSRHVLSLKGLCREAWSQQVSNEQKQLAQDSATARKGLEAARTAELAARKAALEFEARAQLAEKDVGHHGHSS